MGADAIDIAKEILDHGADPLISLDDRQSPLHLAIEHAQPAMLDLILKNLSDDDALGRN
jgi:ankyrin repeat protein